MPSEALHPTSLVAAAQPVETEGPLRGLIWKPDGSISEVASAIVASCLGGFLYFRRIDWI